MRLLWLCNNAPPGVIRAHQNHTPVEAVNWVDQVLEGWRVCASRACACMCCSGERPERVRWMTAAPT